MSESQFEAVKLPRPGSPDLGISFLKPQDWNLLKIPDEPLKFEEPAYFLALAIAMAPYGTVLFTVAARPAFDDGTVRDWAQYLCGENKIEIVSDEDTTLGGLRGCLVIGAQDSEAGRLKMRVFFFEDGKRLFQTNIIAPEQIWPSVEQQLDFMQRSFRLDQVLGQTTPTAPPTEPLPVHRAEQAPAEVPPYEPPPIEEPSQDGPPADPDDWRTQVDQLEQAGQIEEAEALLLKSINHLGAYSSAAYLWEREVGRRVEKNDLAGAKAAARKARDLLYAYAAGATSGGEGTALSREAEQRIKPLKPYLD